MRPRRYGFSTPRREFRDPGSHRSETDQSNVFVRFMDNPLYFLARNRHTKITDAIARA
jgi:hypothetical protein